MKNSICPNKNPLPISGLLANVHNVKISYTHHYIGRPTKWGNPLTVRKFGRENAISKYEEHLISSGLINDTNYEIRF